MHVDVERILIPSERIDERVSALATEIAAVYGDVRAGVTIVTILAGSIVFLGDLIRKLPMKLRIALVGVSSYPGRSTESRGAVLAAGALPDVRGHDVLIVDDILDTGGTLRLVQAEMGRASPRSVRTAVLLRKAGKAPADVAVDFVGFDIEDVFVVGYGLDYDGLYRNLPYIAVLKSSVMKERESV